MEIMKNIPRPEHPEPMMYRKSWQNLNGEWLFETDCGVSGEERGMFKNGAENMYSQKILVPFCPESKLSGIENKDFMDAVWYRRSFSVSEVKVCGRVLLHFGAVDYACTVYVNEKKVDTHYGGYTSFTMDITDFVKSGENILTVYAEDRTRSVRQPHGKQCCNYYSAGCDYTRTTGIWQTVWLEFVPDSYIKSVKYYPDIKEGAFHIELTASSGGVATVEAFYEGKPMGKVEREFKGTYARLHLKLDEIYLWEAGFGRLYDFKITLKTENSTDTVASYCGLREIRIDGFKVLINEKSVFQRTVLDQGFYPDGIYTAPTDADLKKDIEISMALGFNGARLHQKVFEARFLYHCDKAGYLVWGEHANWGLNVNDDLGLLGFMPEWLEAVNRDFNHPSIIGWCPFNETWGYPNTAYRRIVKAVYDETKRVDPTRPIIDTSGGFHVITDINDEHDYDQNPESFRAAYANYDGSFESVKTREPSKQVFIPNLPFFLSEYGGIRWVRKEDCEGTPENAWGYGESPKTEDEFFSRYEGLTSAIMEAPNIMGFCYTQLYDIEQEINGFYCYDRSPKFDDYSRVIVQNKKKAAIEE